MGSKFDFTRVHKWQDGNLFRSGDLLSEDITDAVMEFDEANKTPVCGTGVDFQQLEPGHYTGVISQVGADSVVFYQLKFAE